MKRACLITLVLFFVFAAHLSATIIWDDDIECDASYYLGPPQSFARGWIENYASIETTDPDGDGVHSVAIIIENEFWKNDYEDVINDDDWVVEDEEAQLGENVFGYYTFYDPESGDFYDMYSYVEILWFDNSNNEHVVHTQWHWSNCVQIP